MPGDRIPIVLVRGRTQTELRPKIEASPNLRIEAEFSASQVQKIPKPKHPVPEVFFVIDGEAIDRHIAVIASLILRNEGHQVFITTASDFEAFQELIADVFKYTTSLIDKDSPFETEVLVTETAMSVLGDISPIIKYFETEHVDKDNDLGPIH